MAPPLVLTNFDSEFSISSVYFFVSVPAAAPFLLRAPVSRFSASAYILPTVGFLLCTFLVRLGFLQSFSVVIAFLAVVDLFVLFFRYCWFSSTAPRDQETDICMFVC